MGYGLGKGKEARNNGIIVTSCQRKDRHMNDKKGISFGYLTLPGEII